MKNLRAISEPFKPPRSVRACARVRGTGLHRFAVGDSMVHLQGCHGLLSLLSHPFKGTIYEHRVQNIDLDIDIDIDINIDMLQIWI